LYIEDADGWNSIPLVSEYTAFPGPFQVPVLSLLNWYKRAGQTRSPLQDLTAGKGFERAIDCVAEDLGAEIARSLAPAGTMLVY
jgi:hypothetical protein